MSRLSTQIPTDAPAAMADRDLATLILTLLSVAEDDRTLSHSLSILRAETSPEDFACGMKEAARRIGVLFGAARELELMERLSANRLPV